MPNVLTGDLMPTADGRFDEQKCVQMQAMNSLPLLARNKIKIHAK